MLDKIYITGTGACGFLEANSLLGSKFEIIYKSENSKFQNAYMEQNKVDYPIWDKDKLSRKKIDKIVDRIAEKSLISHVLIKYVDEMIIKNPSTLILCLRAPKDTTVRNLIWSWGYANPLVTKSRKKKREINRYPLSQFPDYSFLKSIEEATNFFYDEFYNLADHYVAKYPKNFKLIDTRDGIANDLFRLNLIDEVPAIKVDVREIFTTNLNGGIGNMLFQISEALIFAEEFNYPTPRFGYWKEESDFIFPKFYKPDIEFGGHNVGMSVFNLAFENIELEMFNTINFNTHFQVSNMFNFAAFGEKNQIKIRSHVNQRSRAVALHLRFGGLSADISKVPKIRYSFYKKAFKKIPKSLPVYVFSDNTEAATAWVDKFSKKLQREMYLKESGAVNSLLAMANCDYHVLHSSTFSFWSAFLDPEQPNNKVFYPKKFIKLHGPKMVPYKVWVCL